MLGIRLQKYKNIINEVYNKIEKIENSLKNESYDLVLTNVEKEIIIKLIEDSIKIKKFNLCITYNMVKNISSNKYLSMVSEDIEYYDITLWKEELLALKELVIYYLK